MWEGGSVKFQGSGGFSELRASKPGVQRCWGRFPNDLEINDFDCTARSLANRHRGPSMLLHFAIKDPWLEGETDLATALAGLGDKGDDGSRQRRDSGSFEEGSKEG